MIIAYHSLLSRSIKISSERAPGLGAMLLQRLFLFQPFKLPTPGKLPLSFMKLLFLSFLLMLLPYRFLFFTTSYRL